MMILELLESERYAILVVHPLSWFVLFYPIFEVALLYSIRAY